MRSLRSIPASGAFSRQGFPLFATFLIWGVGSGAQSLARPLFAYSLSDSVFLVAVLISSLALSRVVSGPITGFLTDRFGRKPLAVAGAGIRGLASLGNAFAGNYAQFFALEFMGAIGVSMWQTTSQIMVADVSTRANRGRAVALRNTALRLGQILGPLVGALIAASYGLQEVFFVNAGAKGIVLVMTIRLIRETRPEAAPKTASTSAPSNRSVLIALVSSRAFLALAITTFGVHLMGQGVFQTLFPIQASETMGLATAQIGTLISIAGIATLVSSFPNGVLVDRFGRKWSLVPGLLLLGVSAVLLAVSEDYGGALVAVAVFGMAQAMRMGATQAFAMDLAPEQQRGALLGLWAAFQSFGAFAGPLAAGAVVEVWGFGAAFYAVAAWLVLSAAIMGVFGPETKEAAGSPGPSAAPQ